MWKRRIRWRRSCRGTSICSSRTPLPHHQKSPHHDLPRPFPQHTPTTFSRKSSVRESDSTRNSRRRSRKRTPHLPLQKPPRQIRHPHHSPRPGTILASTQSRAYLATSRLGCPSHLRTPAPLRFRIHVIPCLYYRPNPLYDLHTISITLPSFLLAVLPGEGEWTSLRQGRLCEHEHAPLTKMRSVRNGCEGTLEAQCTTQHLKLLAVRALLPQSL